MSFVGRDWWHFPFFSWDREVWFFVALYGRLDRRGGGKGRGMLEREAVGSGVFRSGLKEVDCGREKRCGI